MENHEWFFLRKQGKIFFGSIPWKSVGVSVRATVDRHQIKIGIDTVRFNMCCFDNLTLFISEYFYFPPCLYSNAITVVSRAAALVLRFSTSWISLRLSATRPFVAHSNMRESCDHNILWVILSKEDSKKKKKTNGMRMQTKPITECYVCVSNLPRNKNDKYSQFSMNTGISIVALSI